MKAPPSWKKRTITSKICMILPRYHCALCFVKQCVVLNVKKMVIGLWLRLIRCMSGTIVLPHMLGERQIPHK